nr:hypothetical protein HmN_000947600 [Hymenolepis microstoma]
MRFNVPAWKFGQAHEYSNETGHHCCNARGVGCLGSNQVQIFRKLLHGPTSPNRWIDSDLHESLESLSKRIRHSGGLNRIRQRFDSSLPL